MGEFVGGRIVPKHCGVWNKNTKYEMISIVFQPETGNSYISRKNVPAGTALSSEEYWALSAEYSAQVHQLEQDVEADVEQMHTDVNQTKAAMSRELEDTRDLLEDTVSKNKAELSDELEKTRLALTATVNNAVSNINTGLSEVQKTELTLNKRMDSLTRLPNGSTKADAELMDIRVAVDGTVYDTAGSSVRTQIECITKKVKKTIALSAEGWIQGYPTQSGVAERITLPIGKIGVGTLHILAVAENTHYGVQGYSEYPFTSSGKVFDSGWKTETADYAIDPTLYYAILVGEKSGGAIDTVAGSGYTVTVDKDALALIDENTAGIEVITKELEETKRFADEGINLQHVFENTDLWIQGNENHHDTTKRVYLPLGVLRVTEGKISVSEYELPIQYGIRGFTDDTFKTRISDTGWVTGSTTFEAKKGVFYTVLAAKKGLTDITPSDMDGFTVTVSTSVTNELAENTSEIRKTQEQLQKGLLDERQKSAEATDTLQQIISKEITGRQKIEVEWKQGSYTGVSNTDPTRIKSMSAFKRVGEGIVRVALAEGYNAAIRTYNAAEADAPFVIDTGWKRESFTLQFDAAFFRIAVKKADDTPIAISEGKKAVDVAFILSEKCLQSMVEANEQTIKSIEQKHENLEQLVREWPLISQTVRTIAHRGNDIDAPQNVTASYIKARKRGHTIAENDLTKTKDGEYVVWHDPTLGRLGNLKDLCGRFLYNTGENEFFWYDADTGEYLSEDYEKVESVPENIEQCHGSEYSVEKMNLALLKKIDFGSWFSTVYSGEQILTFREWVMLCKKIGMEVYVDKKIAYTNEILRDLFGIVRECGMLDKASWIGLSHAQAQYVREKLDSNARFGILSNPTDSAVKAWKDIQQAGRGFFFDGDGKTITRESAQIGLAAGFEVECYYVDFGRITAEKVFEKLRELVDFGLTGITTDKYRVDEAFSYLMNQYE